MQIPAFRPGRFHLLFGCMLVIGAGNSMLFSLLPPLMRRLELNDSGIGWIFSLSAMLWVFAAPYWGRVSDRTGRKPMIAFGLGAYAVSMGLFALTAIIGLLGWIEGAVLFFALMLTRAIFGAFGSSASPAAQAYIADNTTAENRTEELAALTAAFALGQALGPAFCAALALGHRPRVSDRDDLGTGGRRVVFDRAFSAWRRRPCRTPGPRKSVGAIIDACARSAAFWLF